MAKTRGPFYDGGPIAFLMRVIPEPEEGSRILVVPSTFDSPNPLFSPNESPLYLCGACEAIIASGEQSRDASLQQDGLQVHGLRGLERDRLG